jgi:hypothetical protein
MTERPVYIGVGECVCKRIDVQLYRVPGTLMYSPPVCSKCLKERGFEAPKPRTADDIEMIDGQTSWKPTAAVPATDPPLDLGHGHLFAPVLDHNEQLIGWLHSHPDARSENGVLCQSFCAVRALDGIDVHEIVSVEPLTLIPSLKCRTCGSHGHVTNGRWEPC